MLVSPHTALSSLNPISTNPVTSYSALSNPLTMASFRYQEHPALTVTRSIKDGTFGRMWAADSACSWPMAFVDRLVNRLFGWNWGICSQQNTEVPTKLTSKQIEDLSSNSKRSIEQTSPSFTVSNPQLLLQNISAFTLCGSIDSVAIFGTRGSQQMVEFFTFQNGNLTRESASAAINALLPSLAPPYELTSACGYNNFHVITKKAANLFHSVFSMKPGNQTLVTSPYSPSVAITDATRPAITKSGNGIAIPTLNNGTSYFTTTNTTNKISSRGPAINSATLPPEALSLQDGRVFVFHKPTNNTKLYVTVFNQFSTVDGTYILDLNQTTIGETLIEALYGPKTPLPSGAPVPLILTANNHTSDFLISYLTNAQSIASSQKLSNAGIGPNGQSSLADCGNNTFIYARDIALNQTQFGIGYGKIQANLTSNILIGNEQILTFALPVPGNPQVTCLSNGRAIIGYKDNGDIASVTVDLSSSNAIAPAPAAPAPLPNTSSIIEVDVSHVGLIPVQVDVTIIRISPDIVSITLVDEGGFKFTYFANATEKDVPLGVPFSPSQVFNFSIVKNANATDGIPIFLGCDAGGHCTNSTAKNSAETAFGSGTNLTLILSATFAAVGATAIGFGVFWYYYWFREHQRSLQKRDQQVRENINTPAGGLSAEGQEARQKKWEAALQQREEKQKDLTEPLISLSESEG